MHARTRPPHFATFVVTAVILVLALWLPLVQLAKFTRFVILVVFALINLALLRIKRRHPHPPSVRTYPAWIPWAGFISTTGFVSYQLVTLLPR